MKHKSRANRGQFFIIAALLVAIILMAAVIMTYTTISNIPFQESPKVLSSIGETNLSINKILEFTTAYYGSILKVTGNTTYAKSLALSYLRSGLINIARSHPEWNPSFEVNYSDVSTQWFAPTSYSSGNISVTYSLSGLGIEEVKYETSSLLKVTILGTLDNKSRVLVTREENKPELSLGIGNFFFYCYSYDDSAWKLVSPDGDPVTFSNGTYVLPIPSGVDKTSYMVHVADQRGIMVTSFFSTSGLPQYTYALDWDATGKEYAYSSLTGDTIVVEALQNGTLRWLGQNLQLLTQGKPIPPIPVKALRINQTINGVSREVPFQVEDWGSNCRIPLGLTGNASIFSSRNMLVFLVNHRVEKVTLWWDGRDIANQTSYAWKNRYFTDDPDNGVLSNGDLTLNIGVQIEYLYVNSFSGSRTDWVEVGSSPYLNDADSNYIWDNDDYDVERYFYFEDSSASSGTVESAKIQFECRCNGDDYFQFQIYNGYSTYGWYSITGLPSSYGWKEYDVSSILNSLSRVNNARIEVRYRQSGSGASDLFIRRCRLFVKASFSDFKITSTVGTSVAQAEFLRVNGEKPVYGADPAYVIYNGVVRDIVQQEAEWSSGAPNCPDVYSQIVLTLPANSTYYTYAARTIFVDTSQSRNLNELNVIELTIYPGGSGTGECITEDGINPTGFPVPSYLEGLFYNSSSTTGWAHHWSEFLKGNNGAGIMFTNNSNFKLYTFDSIASEKTGALDVDKQASNTRGHIEVNPVERYQASFTYPLDVTWHGAVVTFDSVNEQDTIYPSPGGGNIGLWLIAEHLPTITVS